MFDPLLWFGWRPFRRSEVDPPALDASEVVFRWSCLYSNGPNTGVARYRWKYCWFENIDERVVDGKVLRKFHLYEMNDSQILETFQWQKLYEEFVGSINLFDENKKLLEKTAYPGMTLKFFDLYRKKKQDLVFARSQIIGWFEIEIS